MNLTPHLLCSCRNTIALYAQGNNVKSQTRHPDAHLAKTMYCTHGTLSRKSGALYRRPRAIFLHAWGVSWCTK